MNRVCKLRGMLLQRRWERGTKQVRRKSLLKTATAAELRICLGRLFNAVGTDIKTRNSSGDEIAKRDLMI